MPKKKKMAVTVLCALLLLLLAALIFAGNYMVSFAIGRTTGTTDVAPPSVVSEEDSRAITENWQRLAQQTQDWAEAVQRGYNVLLPDLRGCGESGGDYIGMGWPDRKDMLQWIDWIAQRDPETRIVLHGISMGGATVMMTSGEKLPAQVKAIVEDCGYTSVWDIFEDEMAVLFHLPAFPVLHTASLFSSLRAGYSFTEASALEQVKKAKVPMLFIHGEKDNFVRTEMVYPLYEACPTEKRLLVVEGAGHGSAYGMDPELYFGTVFDFIAPYMNPEN